MGDHDQFERNWRCNHLNFIRNPTFLCVGRFVPDARQPLRFSTPGKLFDTGGIPIGPKGTAEIATYTSLTESQGRRVLWYPDRKYYLLGKILGEAELGLPFC